jgi:hypothetical protein
MTGVLRNFSYVRQGCLGIADKGCYQVALLNGLLRVLLRFLVTFVAI